MESLRGARGVNVRGDYLSEHSSTFRRGYPVKMSERENERETASVCVCACVQLRASLNSSANLRKGHEK